jgi:hypothetical protein
MRKRESFLIIRSVARDCQAERSDGCIIHHREREYLSEYIEKRLDVGSIDAPSSLSERSKYSRSVVVY